MAGTSTDITTNDLEILKINSPRARVKGPYIVVYKNVNERWAIVALDWDGQPALGIRWFWGNWGNPYSRRPTWLIIPATLTKNVLAGLPIDHKLSGDIDDYLKGKLPGNSLKHY